MTLRGIGLVQRCFDMLKLLRFFFPDANSENCNFQIQRYGRFAEIDYAASQPQLRSACRPL